MEYTKLGNTGMDVSRICLVFMGFGDATRWIHQWVLNEANSRPIIKKALELGINFFDTANVSSIGASEEILGRALSDFANRDQVVIATRCMAKCTKSIALSFAQGDPQQFDNSLSGLADYLDRYNIFRYYQTPLRRRWKPARRGEAGSTLSRSSMFLAVPEGALHS